MGKSIEGDQMGVEERNSIQSNQCDLKTHRTNTTNKITFRSFKLETEIYLGQICRLHNWKQRSCVPVEFMKSPYLNDTNYNWNISVVTNNCFKEFSSLTKRTLTTSFHHMYTIEEGNALECTNLVLRYAAFSDRWPLIISPNDALFTTHRWFFARSLSRVVKKFHTLVMETPDLEAILLLASLDKMLSLSIQSRTHSFAWGIALGQISQGTSWNFLLLEKISVDCSTAARWNSLFTTVSLRTHNAQLTWINNDTRHTLFVVHASYVISMSVSPHSFSRFYALAIAFHILHSLLWSN